MCRRSRRRSLLRESVRRFLRRQAHNIDCAGSHPPRIRTEIRRENPRACSRRNSRCPAFARSCPKIPFFCRAVDTRRGLFSLLWGGQMGRLPMKVKASGRSALIIATGLFVCFAGPSQVTAASSDSAAATSKSDSATSGKSVRQSSRHWKRYAHRKSAKAASKSTEAKKAAEKDVADACSRQRARDPAVRRQCQCAADLRRCIRPTAPAP